MKKPVCPVHKIEMVVKTTVSGPADGSKVWVCPNRIKTNCRQSAPYFPYHDIMPPQPLFDVRDRVQLRSDPSRRGRILEGPREYSGGFEYFVVLGEHEAWGKDMSLPPLRCGVLGSAGPPSSIEEQVELDQRSPHCG
jgi:hypothetical protein